MIHRVFALFFGSLALIMLATTLLGFALLTGLVTLNSDTATAPHWRLAVAAVGALFVFLLCAYLTWSVATRRGLPSSPDHRHLP
jgi:membrane protein implicated in regulation of membrane protease activity